MYLSYGDRKSLPAKEIESGGKLRMEISAADQRLLEEQMSKLIKVLIKGVLRIGLKVIKRFDPNAGGLPDLFAQGPTQSPRRWRDAKQQVPNLELLRELGVVVESGSEGGGFRSQGCAAATSITAARSVTALESNGSVRESQGRTSPNRPRRKKRKRRRIRDLLWTALYWLLLLPVFLACLPFRAVRALYRTIQKRIEASYNDAASEARE